MEEISWIGCCCCGFGAIPWFANDETDAGCDDASPAGFCWDSTVRAPASETGATIGDVGRASTFLELALRWGGGGWEGPVGASVICSHLLLAEPTDKRDDSSVDIFLLFCVQNYAK